MGRKQCRHCGREIAWNVILRGWLHTDSQSMTCGAAAGGGVRDGYQFAAPIGGGSK